MSYYNFYSLYFILFSLRGNIRSQYWLHRSIQPRQASDGGCEQTPNVPHKSASGTLLMLLILTNDAAGINTLEMTTPAV